MRQFLLAFKTNFYPNEQENIHKFMPEVFVCLDLLTVDTDLNCRASELTYLTLKAFK